MDRARPGDRARSAVPAGEARQLRVLVDSQSADNQRWIVTAYSAERPVTYFLYDRRRNTLDEQFSARPELAGYRLAPMQSHVVKARDGRDLVSYLTLPTD
jgi:acylaminoacyl-peptidase